MTKEMNYLLEYKCDGSHSREGVGHCDEFFRIAHDSPEWPNITTKNHLRSQLHVGNYLCGQFRPYRIWADYKILEAEREDAKAEYLERTEKAEMAEDLNGQ